MQQQRYHVVAQYRTGHFVWASVIDIEENDPNPVSVQQIQKWAETATTVVGHVCTIINFIKIK